MINVKILKGDELQKLINIIKTFKLLNDYISLIFDNEGLYIQGMDNSHICLYELSIKKEWFESYQFQSEDEDDKNILTCASTILNKIMGLCKPSESIMIGSLDNEKIEITIFQNDDIDNGKIFQIPCINLDCQQLQPYEINYDYKLTIDSKELANFLSELSHFGDELQIFTYKDMIKFKSESNEGSMSQKKKIYEYIASDCNTSENIYCKFQINYLNNIMSLHKVFSITEFSFQNDVPLSISFHEINQLDTYLLDVKFYLAPKIIDNEDEINNIDFEKEF